MVFAVTKMSGLMSSGGQSLRRFCPDALSGDWQTLCLYSKDFLGGKPLTPLQSGECFGLNTSVTRPKSRSSKQ